jgi:chromosome condensin MukBEF MukE localization factor
LPLNHSSKFSQLTDQHLQAIGKIVVEWSNIEYLFGVLLCRLLLTNEFLGRGFTNQMSAFQILAAIEDALDIHEKRYSNSIVDKKTVAEK